MFFFISVLLIFYIFLQIGYEVRIGPYLLDGYEIKCDGGGQPEIIIYEFHGNSFSFILVYQFIVAQNV